MPVVLAKPKTMILYAIGGLQLAPRKFTFLQQNGIDLYNSNE
jgi:hypothetical protein